ncbi:MAG TPA: hypothetical protein VFA02_01545 [Pseudacidobacterium sp.]|nr:hypothetical protein [Pseudacidobacterium sp.]
MKYFLRKFSFLLWMFLIATALIAQEQQQQQPAADPDDGSGVVLQSANDGPDATDGDVPTVTADERPLTGGRVIGTGSRGPRHSFFVPGFRVAQILDSNAEMVADSHYRGFSSLNGDLQLIHYFGSSTSIRYAGAVRYDTRAEVEGLQQFTNAHALSVSRLDRFRSWDLLFDNETQYSQGSNFGATGMEGLGSVITATSTWGGVGNIQLESTALQPDLAPNQSILTLRSGRVSNTVLGEADYRPDDKYTFTMTGFYGLLHFTDKGLIDTSQEGFVAGANRALSPTDSIAFEYGFSNFNFSGTTESLKNNYIGILYGRKLTGQIAVSAGAGPQFISDRTSISNDDRLGWQGRATLDWQMRRVGLHAAVLRNLTSGSGVLFGAYTNSIQGGMGYGISRNWDSSFIFGWARNTAVTSALRYNTQYFGASAGRHVGRDRSIFFSYDLQHQTSFGCASTTCAVNGVRHVFGVGFSWTHQPIGMF